MDLYQLEYFVEIARQGNFTRAARQIGIVQPALSQQIKRLEEELGTLLFVRDRRRARLTAAGETLLEHAQQLLAKALQAKEAVIGMGRLESGKLTIAAIPAVSAFYLPGHINMFRKTYPAIELLILEESSDGVTELVGNGVAEVGFLQLPETDPRLETTRLLTEPHHVILHRRHSLAKSNNLTLKQLSGESFIQYRGKVRDTVLQACRQAGFEPRIACATGELSTVHALVRAGLGLSVLPELAIPPGLTGVRAIQLHKPTLNRSIGIATRHSTPQSAACQAFINLISERLND